MPEGHSIRYYANQHARWFEGHPLRVGSPQGRFTGGASALDGRVLRAIETRGKHALWHFDGAPSLHVHLGLYGKYRNVAVPPPEPKGAVRMRVEGPKRVVDLIGPTRCELLDRFGVKDLLHRIGEDPLRDDADPEKVIDRFARTKRPVAVVLLDQSIIAGIGNVYRAELLFVSNMDPMRPASSLSRDEVLRLWAHACTLLAVGAKHDAIRVVGEDVDGPQGREAVDPESMWTTGRYGPRKDRLWVYRRSTCKICGSAIHTEELAGRRLYACPGCQPPSSG